MRASKYIAARAHTLMMMRRYTVRERSSAVTTSSTADRTKTMPAASTVTSAPAPIAMPTSAAASAGESFTPSPTCATQRAPHHRPRRVAPHHHDNITARLQVRNDARLVRRQRLRATHELHGAAIRECNPQSGAHLRDDAVARDAHGARDSVRGALPVARHHVPAIIRVGKHVSTRRGRARTHTRSPQRASSATAAAAHGASASRTPTTPAAAPATATTTTVMPSSAILRAPKHA